jgi:hypothetical protein
MFRPLQFIFVQLEEILTALTYYLSPKGPSLDSSNLSFRHKILIWFTRKGFVRWERRTESEVNLKDLCTRYGKNASYILVKKYLRVQSLVKQ